MYLSVCGFNHKSASLVEREAFQLSRSELTKATQSHKELSGCREAVVVATCNRVEFYRLASLKSNHFQEVIRFFEKRGVPDAKRMRDFCYCHQGTTAARHLFRVAAGLDSLVLGEDQVFHQLKDAYSAACAANGPGKVLHKLFHMAFQVGKRIRNSTEIGTGPRSIPGAALELLKERRNGEIPSAALVCGVNEMTEIILDGLQRWGAPTILANRTLHKAEKLAASFKAKSIPLDRVGETINKVEVIFSATSSPDYVITGEHFRNFKPSNRKLYLIDIAVPRDIEPELGEIPGVILFNLQDMKRYLEYSVDMRSRDIPLADTIIGEQVSAFSLWQTREKQRVKLLNLREELNSIRKEKLEKFKEGFHNGEYKALEAFSQAMVRDFLRLAPRLLDNGDKNGSENKEAERFTKEL